MTMPLKEEIESAKIALAKQHAVPRDAGKVRKPSNTTN